MAISGSDDGTIALWDVRAGSAGPRWSSRVHESSARGVGKSGDVAMTCGDDGAVCGIDLRSYRCEKLRGSDAPRTCVHALAGGEFLCAGGDGVVELLSVRGVTHELQGPSDVGVCAMHVHEAPGTPALRVALGHADGSCSVWS